MPLYDSEEEAKTGAAEEAAVPEHEVIVLPITVHRNLNEEELKVLGAFMDVIGRGELLAELGHDQDGNRIIILGYRMDETSIQPMAQILEYDFSKRITPSDPDTAVEPHREWGETG